MNSVTRETLLEYYDKNLATPFGSVAELVLKGHDYTNDAKVRIIQKYITTMLELSFISTLIEQYYQYRISNWKSCSKERSNRK
ncbi:hypothetical protein MT418_003689 [Batrachochytrium dendrobatidis]